MKIIINSSTFKGTGVTQVAVSFIHECINFPENEYLVFMSPNVASNINQKMFPQNFTFYTFGKHSLYGLRGIPDLYKMKRIEASYKPDAVFSVFGPSLWKPKAPHLQGYAFPHYIYVNSPAFDRMTFREKMGVKLRQFVHIGHMKHEGKYFVCETEDVSEKLHELHHIKRDRIFTVSNTANSYFLNYKSERTGRENRQEFRFYSLCSNSPHKNLSILNEVIPILKSRNLSKKILFYVTIPQKDYDAMFCDHVKDYIVNVGPLKVADCPAFVDSCDALFLPTLLECFSASYPEAMLLTKPIVTSDLPFATTVCKDAALYFDPYNAHEIADCIISIVEDENLRNDLVLKGKKQLNTFSGPRKRAIEYLKICKQICGNEKG